MHSVTHAFDQFLMLTCSDKLTMSNLTHSHSILSKTHKVANPTVVVVVCNPNLTASKCY